MRQRDALAALGVTSVRPDRELATVDPSAYLGALATAGQAGELLDPAGLGAFWWIVQPVGLPTDPLAGPGHRAGGVSDLSGRREASESPTTGAGR